MKRSRPYLGTLLGDASGVALGAWTAGGPSAPALPALPALLRPYAREAAGVQSITSFQAGHGWSFLSGTTGNLNATTEGHVLGSQCVRFDAVASAARGIRRLGAPAIDLTGKYLGILLRVDNPDVLDGVTTFSLDVGSSSLANFWRFRLDSDKIQQFYTAATPRADGGGYWAHYTIPWEPGGDWLTVTGTPNRASVTDMQVRISLGAGEPTSRIAVQEIYSVPEPTAYPNGALCITSDDGKLSFVEKGLAILGPRNCPATMYLQAYSTDLADLGSAPGYATTAQLQAAAAAGWAMCAHAYDSVFTPDPGYPGFTEAAARADFASLQAWLVAKGWGATARHSSYPNGDFSYAGPSVVPLNDRVDYTAAEIFSTSRTIYDRCPETIPPAEPNRLRTIYVTSSDSLATIQARVQRAAQAKACAILVFHELVPGAPAASTEWNENDFAALIDYAISLGMALRTVPQVYG